jgi:hypothetical protein
MMNQQSTPQILVFYPSRSLSGQLQIWSDQHGGRQVQFSFERSMAGIRRQLHRVDFVLVDATENPSQAADAYFQAYKTVGADAMSVYTDIVHDGLELLVRRLGVTLLLGPMSIAEWDDFFTHKFPRTIPLVSAQGSAQSQSPEQNGHEDNSVNSSFPFKSIAG